jgi:hypothetical protein
VADHGRDDHIGRVRTGRIGIVARRARPVGGSSPERKCVVSVDGLINISASANTAFGSFDWTEHAGKGVRLFVQGFG